MLKIKHSWVRMQSAMGRTNSASMQAHGTHTANWFLVVAISLLTMGAAKAQDSASAADSSNREKNVSVTMKTTGVGRYVPQRWGMVAADVFNRSKEEISGLIVVTPENSGGVQYARKVDVPPEMQFSTSWPVRFERPPNAGRVEFGYLYFPAGEEDGVIRRKTGESALPTITGMMSEGARGISGIIPGSDRKPGDLPGTEKKSTELQDLLRAMRFNKLSEVQVMTFQPGDLGPQREYLDSVDQLAIGDPQLLQYPHVCDAIRAWVCRGGRLLIAMDECGPEVTQYLLGGVMSLSVVGEVHPTSVNLELNPDYSEKQFPVRSVTREFVEPIRYYRVLPNTGEPIWTVDGWPVAMRVPMGLGIVLVTTIDSRVFIEPRTVSPDKAEASYGVIASSRRMLDSMFNPRTPKLITEPVASSYAAQLIGYQIPARFLVTILLLLFPAAIVVTGLLLQRKEQGQRLVWLLPVVAIVTTVPSVIVGARLRAVAPTTVIETSAIASTPGETQLVADGFASVYLPDPTTLSVSSTGGTVLDVAVDPTNQDYKRLIWSDPMTSRWDNLQQHVGLKTHAFSFEKSIPSAIQAIGTFDEKGLVGTLRSEGLTLQSPLVLASENRAFLSLESNGAEFRGVPSDLLATGQYFKSSFVSDESRTQSILMGGVFDSGDRQELFPPQPTILFWVDPDNNTFQIGDESVRRRQAALVAQPLQLIPPEANRLITIPAPFLSYRSISTESGSLSSVFSNQTRLWSGSESSSSTRLQFEIPTVCRPFEVTSAEISVSIRAASRQVRFRWADPKGEMREFQKLDSPLGSFTLTVPPELISKDRISQLIVELQVSDIGDSGSSAGEGMPNAASGEQDDSWKIDRLMLNLTGRRVPVSVATN